MIACVFGVGFAVTLPRGESSRSLTFAYRAHIGDAQPVVAHTLALSVRAGSRHPGSLPFSLRGPDRIS